MSSYCIRGSDPITDFFDGKLLFKIVKKSIKDASRWRKTEKRNFSKEL